MKKIPSFFTFFRSGADDDNLIIPKAFSECMEESFPERVFLRNRNNRLWTVKVAEVGQYWRFVNGWKKFAIDNSLETRDLLVFSYVQKNIFNVKLYGSCGTQKNIVGPSTMRGIVKSHQQILEYEETDEDDDENQMTECEDSDQESEGEQVAMGNVNNEGSRGNNRRGRTTHVNRKWYAMEIFEAGLAERPINPYYVTRIKPKRRASLFIPVSVIKDHKLTLEDVIILVDPEGREFKCKCKMWLDGRWVVSGRWAQLCRINMVNEKDKCICEFVRREGDHRQFLRISFVRL